MYSCTSRIALLHGYFTLYGSRHLTGKITPSGHIDPLPVALLDFAQVHTHSLRILYSVDIGMSTATPRTLDAAAFCLASWLAAISVHDH